MDLRGWWQRGLCATLVVALYGSPLGLTGWLGLVGVSTEVGDPAGSTDVIREAVWYEPPGPDLAAAAQEPLEEPVPTEPEEPPPSGEAPPDDAEPVDPADDAVADASSDEPTIDSDLAMVASPSEVRARPTRVRRAAQRVPRVLTPQQEREKRRRQRKRERQAQQKQCAELTDHVLLVADDEAWMTRELVDCYLAHPEQSYRMGGTWWEEDGRGKRIGFGVRVSKRHPLASEFGLQTGDIVLSVNGFKLRTWSGVTLAAPNILRDRLKLKILRGGEKQVHLIRVRSKRQLDDERSVLSLAQRQEQGTGAQRHQDAERDPALRGRVRRQAVEQREHDAPVGAGGVHPADPSRRSEEQ